MKWRLILIIPSLMILGGVQAQDTYLERSSPNAAAAQLYFFARSSHNASEQNWKIATLPTSSNSTGDKLLIELFGGSHNSSTTFQSTIHVANRNGFNGYVRELYGTVYSSIRIRAYSQSDGSVDVFLTLLTTGWKGAGVRIYEGSGITSIPLVIYENPANVTPTGTLIFDSYDETSGITIKNDGHVGIGTNTPDNKLDVAGTIRAEEVKVETGWADYVFHEDYELKTLSEVSTYIQENHHLPGIPTAKEVAENGIALGEMNAKLLEKIEELTLYLIEKDREIERLQKRDQQLIERIEKLEKESEP